MPRHADDSRQHIIAAANRLFYRCGYNQTSFSDIAAAAAIPRGNFYYYFKTKDEILAAVVADRISKIQAQLRHWEAAEKTPKGRLRRFLEMVRGSERDLARYGCPLGSLIVELGKAQPALKAKARKMFDLYRDWLAAQFAAMGDDDPAARALHLLTRAQGVAVIAQAYADRQYIQNEVDALQTWVDRQ